METPQITRFVGDEDALEIWWLMDETLVDFSSGYTFEVKVAARSDLTTVLFTKTTGFTGAVGSGNTFDGTPNLTIDWATTGELNSLTAGRYVLQIKAAKDSDSSETTMQVDLFMKARLG